MPRIIRQPVRSQKGIVLIVALLILMVMTVIGTSMLSTATLEERMASNLQSQNASFQAANSCFKDSINTPPLVLGLDYPVVLSNAINNMDVAQTNNCNDAAGADLYGAAFVTSATVTADSTVPFRPRGYELDTVMGISIPMTVTSTLGASGAGATIQVSGGVIIPQ